MRCIISHRKYESQAKIDDQLTKLQNTSHSQPLCLKSIDTERRQLATLGRQAMKAGCHCPLRENTGLFEGKLMAWQEAEAIRCWLAVSESCWQAGKGLGKSAGVTWES